MAVSSPPTRFPCYYGIDTSRREELIASTMEVEEIRKFIGADSLQYLSNDGMFQAMGGNDQNYCDACFSGNYPLGLESQKKKAVNFNGE